MHLKSLVIRVLPLALAIAALALPTRAEDWYLKENIASEGTDPFGTQASTYWTNAVGEAATTIASTDECHIENGKEYKLYATKTFPAPSSTLARLTDRQRVILRIASIV